MNGFSSIYVTFWLCVGLHISEEMKEKIFRFDEIEQFWKFLASNPDAYCSAPWDAYFEF